MYFAMRKSCLQFFWLCANKKRPTKVESRASPVNDLTHAASKRHISHKSTVVRARAPSAAQPNAAPFPSPPQTTTAIPPRLPAHSLHIHPFPSNHPIFLVPPQALRGHFSATFPSSHTDRDLRPHHPQILEKHQDPDPNPTAS